MFLVKIEMCLVFFYWCLARVLTPQEMPMFYTYDEMAKLCGNEILGLFNQW